MRTNHIKLAAVALIAGALIGSTQIVGAQEATPVDYSPAIDPSNFTIVIDNQYYPLQPGAIWTYQGTSADGPESNVVTVTSDTKLIMGVECVVVHDVVSIDGTVTEDTFDYFAQDSDGNVWYFGEDSSDIENGQVASTEGSWLAGVDGAFPGLQMLSSPQEGLQYRQEYQEGVAEDMALISDTVARKTVALGSYEDVLVTTEWTPLEPGSSEVKAYAPGIGLIASRDTEGGIESLELTSYTTSSAATPTS